MIENGFLFALDHRHQSNIVTTASRRKKKNHFPYKYSFDETEKQNYLNEVEKVLVVCRIAIINDIEFTMLTRNKKKFTLILET